MLRENYKQKSSLISVALHRQIQCLIINKTKQYITVPAMPTSESQIVCSNALQHIISHGAQLARDNKTIRCHLTDFSNHQNICVTDGLLYQTGIQSARRNDQENEEDMPVNARKDKLCMGKARIENQSCQNGTQSKNDSNNKNKDTAFTRSGMISRRSSMQTNRKTAIRAKQSKSINDNFVDLSGLIDPLNGRKVTQAMKRDEKQIECLRRKCVSEHRMNKKLHEQKLKQEQIQRQRVQALKNKFDRHMSQKNNNFTFDLQGKQLLFTPQTHHHSLRRKYPPSNLTYEFDQPQDPSPDKSANMHIKQKAARGQAFASAVLKTVNMSKFSLNMTTKTCNVDEFAFMKRNDLFNNNHSRQVTTIPFLEISQGTNYTETQTNLSVSKKKSARTSHSENKCKFKTHQLEFIASTVRAGEHNTKTQIIQAAHDDHQREKRRIQSCRPYYLRPRTSVPLTAKTTDRITSVNQLLKNQLIQSVNIN